MLSLAPYLHQLDALRQASADLQAVEDALDRPAGWQDSQVALSDVPVGSAVPEVCGVGCVAHSADTHNHALMTVVDHGGYPCYGALH